MLGRDFLRAQVHIEQSLQPRWPDVDADDLRAGLADILQRARLNQHHTISREQLSVREHMSIVLRRLQGRRFVEFHDLFDTTRGTPVLVVTFIAMLELAREHLLEVTQAEAFAPHESGCRAPADAAAPLTDPTPCSRTPSSIDHCLSCREQRLDSARFSVAPLNRRARAGSHPGATNTRCWPRAWAGRSS
jgi:hypothetical protein